MSLCRLRLTRRAYAWSGFSAIKTPPPPPPAWQRPEPDWSAWSPSPIDGPNRLLTARPDYSGYYPGSRAARDIPRLFEALLPGSGNIVSGDWDRVTAADLGDVGLGLARSLPFFGLEGAGARAGAQVEANAVADAAGAARAARAAPAAVPRSILDNANYAQRWYDESLSDIGPYDGRTINDLVNDPHSNVLKPSDLEVRYIVRDGHVIIQNARTSQVLQRAGISRWEWNAVNKTGDWEAEQAVSKQLRRNGLTSAGAPTVMNREDWLKAGNPLWPQRTR